MQEQLEPHPTQPTATTQAAAMYQLIGGDRALVVEQRGHDAPLKDQGSFHGARFTPELWQLRRHYAGGLAVGIACSFAGEDDERLGTVAFAADIDVRYPERREIYADVLRDLGMARATVCTDGTRPTLSGKVVVYCWPPRPLAERMQLRDEIQKRARRDPRYGPIENPKDVTLFPQRGEGGILRVGGRHATKGKSCDRLTDLAGSEDLDLRDVVPLAELPAKAMPLARAPIAQLERPEGEPLPSALAPLHRPIADALENGLSDEQRGHEALLHFQNRLGREALRLYGPTPAGHAALLAWRTQLEERTPWLNHGFVSPTSRRKGHPMSERSIEDTWRYVCAHPDPDVRTYAGLLNVHIMPVVLPIIVAEIKLLLERAPYVHDKGTRSGKRRRRSEKGTLRLAAALAVVLSTYHGYARDKGLSPDCFPMTYQQAEELTGMPRRTIYKYVGILVSLGLMVLHCRGLDKRHVVQDPTLDGGERAGLHSVVGIVPAGMTPEQLLAGCKPRRVMDRQNALMVTRRRLHPRKKAVSQPVCEISEISEISAPVPEVVNVRKGRDPERPRSPRSWNWKANPAKRTLISIAPEVPAKVEIAAKDAALLAYARERLSRPRRL